MISPAAAGPREMERDRRIGGIFGIVFGASLLTVPFASYSSGTTAAENLSTFDLNRAIFAFVMNGITVLFAFLYAIYLRTALWPRGPTLVTAATAFFLMGILIISGSTLYQASAMATLSSVYNATTSSTADRAAAVVAAQVVQNNGVAFLGFALGIPLGIALFGLAMRNSRIIPNGIGYVGIALGIFVLVGVPLVVLVGFASAAGFVLFLGFLTLVWIWTFGSAAFLWRSARKVPTGEPAPA